jgi:DNA-binding PadR family transcriptional regulator
VSRRYGPPDTRTAAEKAADREAKYLAILRMLYSATEPMIPNEIGQRLKADGHRVPTPHGHSGKRLGEGSAIVPTLRAMERRGWIAWKPRRDGYSGSAYVLTLTGSHELRERIRRDRTAP